MKNSYFVLSIFSLVIFNNINAQDSLMVYFDSNSFQLNDSEINKINQWTENHKNLKVLAINGYADEDGSEGYNDTLSARRVQFVYEKIKNIVLIRDDFEKQHFGKLHLQNKTKAENRRVTIYYLKQENLDQESQLIPLPKEEVFTEKPKIDYPNFIIITNPDGSKTEMNLNAAWIQKIGESKQGEKVILENLEFHLNTFAITNESRPKLFELLFAMQLHPTLEIEIGGHICCILKARGNLSKLSTERAKAIKNFLVDYGIEKERITYRGYGNTQPIYPIPEKSEEERAANRRVEITIISK